MNAELELLDFWAEWCGPCKNVTKILDNLSDKVNIKKINIDDNPEITEQYKVTSVPTILFIKRGLIKDKLNGLITEKIIVDKIESLNKE
jgi:thioredoxin 1